MGGTSDTEALETAGAEAVAETLLVTLATSREDDKRTTTSSTTGEARSCLGGSDEDGSAPSARTESVEDFVFLTFCFFFFSNLGEVDVATEENIRPEDFDADSKS